VRAALAQSTAVGVSTDLVCEEITSNVVQDTVAMAANHQVQYLLISCAPDEFMSNYVQSILLYSTCTVGVIIMPMLELAVLAPVSESAAGDGKTVVQLKPKRAEARSNSAKLRTLFLGSPFEDIAHAQSILFLFQGGLHDEAALDTAILLAQHREVELVILRELSSLTSAADAAVDQSRVNVELLKRIFANTSARFQVKDVPTGDVTVAILDELHERNYTLMILGYSASFVQEARQRALPVPVMVIRAAAQNAQTDSVHTQLPQK